MPVIDKIAPYAKAFIAAAVAALSALVAGFADDGLSWTEGLTAAIAFLVGLAAVFSVPNKPPFTPAPVPEPTLPPVEPTPEPTPAASTPKHPRPRA